MKQTILLVLILLMSFYRAFAIGAEAIVVDEVSDAPQYIRVGVDRVVIDNEGLAIASENLANSIDRLAFAIQQLSINSAALSAEEKEILLNAVKSVDQAGIALAQMATEIPQTAQHLSDRLPQAIRDARQPIADLSSGLESARDGIFAITESLPEATDNAKELVNSALDSALVRISSYSLILIIALALALIGVMWFVYRQYLDPLAQKLDSLVGAPEHFAAMSLYMKETSENLVALQPAPAVSSAPRPGDPSVDDSLPASEPEPEPDNSGAG